MNVGKTVFSQLMDFLPKYEFQKCIERYQGNYKIKSFSCWDQFLAMAFAQLTYRESLRDIQACLRGNQQKLYAWWRFLFYNALGGALWTGFWGVLSYQLGERVSQLGDAFRKIEIFLLGGFIIAALGLVIYMLWRHK